MEVSASGAQVNEYGQKPLSVIKGGETCLFPRPKHSEAFHYQIWHLRHKSVDPLFMPEGDKRPEDVRDKEPEYHRSCDTA